MGETETKINQCGNKQAGSHKTIYITSICQKSIRKFTHRIRKEQHRTEHVEQQVQKRRSVSEKIPSSTIGFFTTFKLNRQT